MICPSYTTQSFSSVTALISLSFLLGTLSSVAVSLFWRGWGWGIRAFSFSYFSVSHRLSNHSLDTLRRLLSNIDKRTPEIDLDASEGSLSIVYWIILQSLANDDEDRPPLSEDSSMHSDRLDTFPFPKRTTFNLDGRSNACQLQFWWFSAGFGRTVEIIQTVQHISIRLHSLKFSCLCINHHRAVS